jgi:hypothetical protein
MTAIDVQMYDDVVCTVTIYGWTAPDTKWVEFLNEAYPISCPEANNVVIWAAQQLVNDFGAEILAIREIPDPEGERDDGEESDKDDSNEENSATGDLKV